VSELQVEEGHVAVASVSGDVAGESADDGAWYWRLMATEIMTSPRASAKPCDAVNRLGVPGWDPEDSKWSIDRDYASDKREIIIRDIDDIDT
jgi:hypothetical protein